MSYSLEGSS